MRFSIPQFERSSIWKSLKVEGRREGERGGGVCRTCKASTGQCRFKWEIIHWTAEKTTMIGEPATDLERVTAWEWQYVIDLKKKQTEQGKSDQSVRPLPAWRLAQEVKAKTEGRADTEEHIFPLPFSFSLFSPPLINSRRKKGRGHTGGGAFDGAQKDRVTESRQTPHLWKYNGSKRRPPGH